MVNSCYYQEATELLFVIELQEYGTELTGGSKQSFYNNIDITV